MVNQRPDPLDRVFSALSDATRRGMIASLVQGPRAVSELAAPYDMSLPAALKHVRVLEDSGLVATAKEGRVVQCSLAPGAIREAMAWLRKYEKFWNERLDALGEYLNQQEKEPWKPPSSSAPRSRSPASSPRRRKKSGRR
jgi:DNA-binding transcriptional ArsR family regulator